jgi:hypothetical protein
MQIRNAATAYPQPAQRIVGIDGIDFVRCRICGDHRRVISGRHLSKHGIDRETFVDHFAFNWIGIFGDCELTIV